ncbi:hypothetical protein WM40_01410 [Robbsia andropogonis]|uniref:Uncharacterized protein n=1 Tax=Robbsia andropogonis TaxID=28092 RepID=A0A0F5K602_9BURK|nr:hypothetical protein WM40_01410 [Robbsia andropogonis]
MIKEGVGCAGMVKVSAGERLERGAEAVARSNLYCAPIPDGAPVRIAPSMRSAPQNCSRGDATGFPRSPLFCRC